MDSVMYNTLVDEKIYFKRLSNNMKCYIIPKAGYVDKQAMLGVNYGSADIAFKFNGRKYELPAGVAHFLEHKLFDDPEVNVFEKFLDLKAGVNAFTNFTGTAYYFNCGDNFCESLALLLEFTGRPYFTAKSVDKEKPIIAREIDMYEDNPFWVMYFNLLQAMYEVSPIRYNIAGSARSIRSINPDILFLCYNAFYRPDNMSLVCVGDIEPERVAEAAENHTHEAEPFDVTRIYGREPRVVSKAYTEKNMALARPMFQLGFKDTDFSTDFSVKIVTTKILLDMIAGESSEFFENLYSNGLIDGPFILEYTAGAFYGMAIYSGSTDQPRETAGRILSELNRIKSEGLDEDRFKRIKRKHLGRFIRGFNSIERLTHGLMELSFKRLDLFDLLNAYKGVTFEQVNKRFNKIFREDNHTTSVVGPVNHGGYDGI